MASPPPPPATQRQRAAFLLSRGRPSAALSAAASAAAAHEAAHGERGLAPFLVQQGVILRAHARLPDAVRVLRRAAALDPPHAPALAALALALHESGPLHLQEALDLLRAAHICARPAHAPPAADSGPAAADLRADPAAGHDGDAHPDADALRRDVAAHLASLLTDVGVRLKTAALPAAAIEHYREALRVRPAYPHALYNLAVAYSDAGEVARAKESYQACVEANPAHVEAWCNLGVLFQKEANVHRAINAYETALSCNPNFDLAKRNLAVALNEQGTAVKPTDRPMAAALYKKALALQPCFADAHYNLAVLYAEGARFQRALLEYNLAVHFNPNLTEAHNNLGVVHKELGNMEMALESYKNALQCDNHHHQTHNNIAVVYTLLGNVDAATHHLRLANSLSPHYAEAHNNMGVLLRDQGDIDTAISHYERCIHLDPTADMAAQNRLHALSYSEKWTKPAVFHQHRLWGAAFQARIDKEISTAATSSPHANDPIAVDLLTRLNNPPLPHPRLARGPATPRPLRVAYLSPDLFTHSVSYFAEALLTHYDPHAFEVYAYANVAQPDAKTARFRALLPPDRWRNIWGLTASAAAALIVKDRIDILVELAGHTANNRLDIMALRLAPVQVTWIGYPNTTGLPSIHYRVTDAIVDPPETTQQFSEKLWRLPHVFLCYTPALDAPEHPTPPPCLTSGGIVTFGSFNVLSKTQARTVKLWAAILKRVPDSRLLLKAKPFGTPSAKRRMERLFEEEGVSADRLDLLPLIPSTRSHLQVYSNVDVALDPFPYAGTTTTCEAMFMGVPVVTLGVRPEHGDHAHNVGVTLLTTVGHPELVAFTDEDYIETAVSLGTDVERLTSIRKRLRNDMMSSPLGQPKAYLRDVEEMFCGMWKERGGVVGDKSAETTEPAGPVSPVGNATACEGCSSDGMGEESAGSTTPQCRTPSDSSVEQVDLGTETANGVVVESK